MKPADIKTTLNYIGGEFVTAASGKTYENRSPVDGSLISMVSEAGQAEVDAAVAAARGALTGHFIPEEDPERTNAVLTDFLAGRI